MLWWGKSNSNHNTGVEILPRNIPLSALEMAHTRLVVRTIHFLGVAFILWCLSWLSKGFFFNCTNLAHIFCDLPVQIYWFTKGNKNHYTSRKNSCISILIFLINLNTNWYVTLGSAIFLREQWRHNSSQINNFTNEYVSNTKWLWRTNVIISKSTDLRFNDYFFHVHRPCHGTVAKIWCIVLLCIWFTTLAQTPGWSKWWI